MVRLVLHYGTRGYYSCDEMPVVLPCQTEITCLGTNIHFTNVYITICKVLLSCVVGAKEP